MRTRMAVIFCLLCLLHCHVASSQNNREASRIHWNAGRGYDSFATATPSGLMLEAGTDRVVYDGCRLERTTDVFTLRFMAANLHNHPSKSYSYVAGDGTRKKVSCPEWGFYVVGDKGDSLIFIIKTIEETDAWSSHPAVTVSANRNLQKSSVGEISLEEGLDLHEGNNIWSLTVNDGEATLSAGNHGLNKVMALAAGMSDIAGFGFMAMPGASLKVSDITFSYDDAMRGVEMTSWSNPDHLENYLKASKDPVEGIWVVFDRTLEETLLQLGGDYRFAMVKHGDIYRLIYLSGARVNGGKWKPGMVKARFAPDSFPGIYSVEWYDSQGDVLSNSVKAQWEDGEVLSLQFPYQSSAMRLRRLP